MNVSSLLAVGRSLPVVRSDIQCNRGRNVRWAVLLLTRQGSVINAGFVGIYSRSSVLLERILVPSI